MAAKNGKAKLVGVIGDPVSHSLSPAIHEYWLHHYDINGAYVPLHVAPEQFSKAISLYRDTGFVGFNVTLPHKEAAFQMMDSLDRGAQICRAVNTIICKANGQLHGMNTDIFGFMKLLEQQPQKAGDNALVIGAGGAARAVVAALLDAGYVTIIIANRTIAKAEKLAEELGEFYKDAKFTIINLDALSDVAAEQHCIINTLSLHMAGVISEVDIIKRSMKDCLHIDISYGSDGTAFTRYARASNKHYADGLPMLLWQAAPGFEQWFGVSPTIDKSLMAHIATQL